MHIFLLHDAAQICVGGGNSYISLVKVVWVLYILKNIFNNIRISWKQQSSGQIRSKIRDHGDDEVKHLLRLTWRRKEYWLWSYVRRIDAVQQFFSSKIRLLNNVNHVSVTRKRVFKNQKKKYSYLRTKRVMVCYKVVFQGLKLLCNRQGLGGDVACLILRLWNSFHVKMRKLLHGFQSCPLRPFETVTWNFNTGGSI